MKRLFIAINLPEEIKRKITQIIINQFQEVRPPEINRQYLGGRTSQKSTIFRWLLPENWHLTISFLGEQPDDAIDSILESIKETARNYSNILENIRIVFEKIILAPPASVKTSAGKPPKSPRMIWLVGAQETSKILGEIKHKLEDELVKNGVRFRRENRGYNAHLTLARFNFGKSDLQKLSNIGEVGLPNIENLSFTAQSLDLIESHLKKTGAEYEILAEVDFK